MQGLRFSLDLGCSKCVPIRFPIMFLVCSQVPMCSPSSPTSTTLYAISFAQNSTQWKRLLHNLLFLGVPIVWVPFFKHANQRGASPPKKKSLLTTLTIN